MTADDAFPIPQTLHSSNTTCSFGREKAGQGGESLGSLLINDWVVLLKPSLDGALTEMLAA